MELVPILSTIILVGTIATFLLAVCAYILYKIRERKPKAQQSGHGAPPPMQHPELGAAPFWEYTDDGLVPFEPRQPGTRPSSFDDTPASPYYDEEEDGDTAWL